MLKLKNGVFTGPMIRTVVNDKRALDFMTNNEKRAFFAFKAVCNNVLGNHLDSDNLEGIIKELALAFEAQNVRMTIKSHFLVSHIKEFRQMFPTNAGDYR